MKSIATRVAGFAFGMLVVMFIFHDDRLGSIWWQTYSDPGGSFSLKFPSKPRVSDQQVKLDNWRNRCRENGCCHSEQNNRVHLHVSR